MGWVLLAAEAPPSGWTDIVSVYGPFAPFALLLLWLLRTLWQDNKEKEAENKELTATAMDKVLPLVLQATQVLGDAVDTLKTIKEQNDSVTRMNILLNDVKDAVEDLERSLRSHNRHGREG